MADCPAYGDIIWIDFYPQAGREIEKRRPALVLSPKAYNKKARLCILCPITSKVKGYPFEVAISVGRIKGAVVSDQIKSMDWIERNARVIQRAPERIVDEVKRKLSVLF